MEDVEDARFRGEDWYGEDVSGHTYRRCRFVDVDLTECTSRGVVFQDCTFTGCTFAGCTLFDV